MKVSYGLPAALIGAAIAIVQPQITAASYADKVEEVKETAREITVLVHQKWEEYGENKQGNGSGSIIAKQGNTYTVLTANHVVCRDQNEVCQKPFKLTVETPDGRTHTIDNSTIKKLPGLDLAVFEFTSDKNYQLATLANYDTRANSEREVRLPNGQVVIEYGHFVFASGWPGINDRDITELNYQFSVGRLLPPDKMVGFKIRPVEEGYEAVYTSITYPGMSGGPVLDSDGRVIAVHGQNEGVKVYNEAASRRERVQIGYSLSIPIANFLDNASRVGISLANITVENNLPAEITTNDLDAIGAEYVLGWIENQHSADTNSAVYWANQGNQYWRALKVPEALKAYNKALEINPEFYPVWYGKGLVNTFKGEYDEAFDNYSKALELIDQKIAEFPQEERWPEIRGWVVKLQNKIQPRANSPTPSSPEVNSAPPRAPEPSPAANPPAPTPPRSPTVQPTPPDPQTDSDPELLW